MNIPINKIDYWTMYVEGTLSLEELLKFLNEKEDNTVWI